MDEFDLIKSCFAPLATSPDAYGLTDDVASLNPPDGKQLIITTDTLVEGIHFLPDDPMGTVAQKLIRVNASDVLAKGGVPWAAVLSLSWTQGRSTKHIQSFADGLKADLKQWGIALMGGDTTSTKGPVTVGLTLIGLCDVSGPVLRSTAQIGDDIWVTGTIGDGAMGLYAARGEMSELAPEDSALLAWRYRVPELPPLEITKLITEHANASADVSDGLIADVGHIAKASDLKAVLRVDDVPFSSAAKSCIDKTSYSKFDLITGGDDYQTVFTASPRAKSAILRANLQYGIIATQIGSIASGEGILLCNSAGDILDAQGTGWKHF